MNNRRKQLMLASAREYCKCVVEGKTIKYNQLFDIDTNEGFSYGTQYNGITLTKQNGRIIINGTSTDGCNFLFYFPNVIKGGHKYFRINLRSNGLGMYDDYEIDDASVVVAETDNDYLSMTIKNGKTFNNYVFNGMFIDLTELGLDSINSVGEFYETDLGKYIAKGNYLPYEPNGKFIHAQSPINFKGVNIWNEQWENGIWYYGTKLTSGSYANFLCSKDKIKVYPNTQYFYYCGTGRTNDYIQLEFYDKNGTTISRLIKDNNSSFVTPDNCYSIAFYINDSYGTTYNNDICINEYNENYNGKYYKYCGNSVFESGLTLKKGDKYKTYGIDKISYNNLIPNANQDYVNSDTDTRASIILSVYDYTNNVGVFAENISSHNFYEFTFTSNTTTNGAKIYNSGVSINQDFTGTISLTNGHLYHLSLNLISCNANVVGGLRIANLRLIDLTELGLSALTDKLRIFLQKNYKLPFTLVNKTIKDQIVRTMVEIDLSTLTWTSEDVGMVAQLPSDFKTFEGNELASVIAEKYKTAKYYDEIQDSICIADVYPYGYSVVIRYGNTTPGGKALLELATPEIITDYPMDFVLSNDNLSYEDSFFSLNGTIFALPNGLIPVLENGIPKLEIIGDEIGFVGIEYGNTPYPSQEDVYYANGFRMSENQIAFTTTNNDGSNVTNTDERVYLVGKTLRVWVTTPRDIPDIMISRRTINVESENEIDLDFTKE